MPEYMYLTPLPPGLESYRQKSVQNIYSTTEQFVSLSIKTALLTYSKK